MRRIDREKQTVVVMVHLYCRHHHHLDELCDHCKALLEFSLERLSRCRYQDNKPTCAKCITHCYREPQRSQMKAIMRYSGPRMLLHHPILAIRHVLDGKKRT